MLFPCGKKARFGVASYKGETKLLLKLEKFVHNYGLKVRKIHRGYFNYCLREPIIKNIFIVGDAAGQTLPLTGEGIRRCVHFGQLCGALIQKILEKEITFKQGQEEYRKHCLKYSNYYNTLLIAQKELPKIANWEIDLIIKLLSLKPITKLAFEEYKLA